MKTTNGSTVAAPAAVLNKYSSRLTQVRSQVGSQAMLYGIGLTDDDMQKPQIGITSMGWEGNTCNMHLNGLALEVKAGVQEAGLVGLIFHTIGVSDGISMGTEGMKFSLVSRDVIADSIEIVMHAQWYDGNISLPGCDKNMPGCIMAMARLNRPSLMVYGGTIRPGFLNEQKLDIVSAFEAYGQWIAGDIDDKELQAVLHNACPGEGACGGMYTANTMASAIETLGMSLPYSSSYPAGSPEKLAECRQAGQAMRNLLEKDIKPRDILTREAFENAIAVVIALGGSTNAVLHLIAIAKAADVPLSLADFQRVSDRTPLLADLKPSGPYVMEDLYAVGGVPAVQRRLLEAGLLHGDCLTVTGKTLAENLADLPDLAAGQSHRLPDRQAAQAHRPFADPVWQSGHRRRGCQDHRQRGHALQRPGAGVRLRGRLPDRHRARQGAGRRRGGDPLRGPQGRPGNARDADGNLGHFGRGARQERGFDHRRPLLGRHPRLRGRTHHARGADGRRARAGAGRRRGHHRRRAEHARRGPVRGGAGAAPRGLGRSHSPASPRACCTST